MGQAVSVWLVLLAALVAANLPFMTERLLIVGPRRHPKPIGWRLLELVLLYLLVGGWGLGLESRIGQIQPQSWEFYAITACLFLVFAFPGFVWRYLMRHRAR